MLIEDLEMWVFSPRAAARSEADKRGYRLGRSRGASLTRSLPNGRSGRRNRALLKSDGRDVMDRWALLLDGGHAGE